MASTDILGVLPAGSTIDTGAPGEASVVVPTPQSKQKKMKRRPRTNNACEPMALNANLHSSARRGFGTSIVRNARLARVHRAEVFYYVRLASGEETVLATPNLRHVMTGEMASQLRKRSAQALDEYPVCPPGFETVELKDMEMHVLSLPDPNGTNMFDRRKRTTMSKPLSLCSVENKAKTDIKKEKEEEEQQQKEEEEEEETLFIPLDANVFDELYDDVEIDFFDQIENQHMSLEHKQDSVVETNTTEEVEVGCTERKNVTAVTLDNKQDEHTRQILSTATVVLQLFGSVTLMD